MSHWNPVDQMQDLVNKFGAEDRIKRFQSGELVLVERNVTHTSPVDLDNGGITFEKTRLNVEAFLDDQAKYLREVFNVGFPSHKKLKLPKVRQGFGWGVVRVRSLSAQRMLDVLKPRFDGKLWQGYSNVDKALDPAKEARTTDKGAYGVWCRARREADDEHKNKSANDLVSLGINGMTEPERIQLEGWFHWKTGGHLDLQNVTLSIGSRCLGGDVPSSYWHSGNGFDVYRFSAGDLGSGIRAREVVSL